LILIIKSFSHSLNLNNRVWTWGFMIFIFQKENETLFAWIYCLEDNILTVVLQAILLWFPWKSY
jgi:hypothetical protein